MSIYDTHKPPVGEGGLYRKLKDGETMKVRIVSEPAIMDAESDDKETGEKRLTTRYGWLFWDQENKQVIVWSQGVRFFRNIVTLAQDEEWGDPKDYDIKITRQGSDTSTTYNVTPSANREPLDREVLEQIKAIDLIEKLKASPFNQRVMWLSDFDEHSIQPESHGHAKEVEVLTAIGDSKKADKIPDDEPVIENVDDEINLDDIPF